MFRYLFAVPFPVVAVDDKKRSLEEPDDKKDALISGLAADIAEVSHDKARGEMGGRQLREVEKGLSADDCFGEGLRAARQWGVFVLTSKKGISYTDALCLEPLDCMS